MIKSFKDAEAKKLFERGVSRRLPPDIQRAATRKLRLLDAAGDVGDLRAPPGNRLEALSGNRKGQYSLRVNDQYRICFIWDGEGARDVEIVDYH